jgi:hypothetical protein
MSEVGVDRALGKDDVLLAGNVFMCTGLLWTGTMLDGLLRTGLLIGALLGAGLLWAGLLWVGLHRAGPPLVIWYGPVFTGLFPAATPPELLLA